MQVAEAKTSSSAKNQIQAKRQPFFSKEGQGGFFSKSAENSNSFFGPTTMQPKLTIGQPNDKYEVEADAMADKVVPRLSSSENDNVGNSLSGNSVATIQSKFSESNEEEKLQKKGDEVIEKDLDLQLKSSLNPDPEYPKEEEKIQTKSESQEIGTADLENQLSSSSSGGNALPSGLRSTMGSEFGADFSGIRVHTDNNAVEMSKDLGAQAFTHGNDIYFNQGKYSPETSSGKHLLAHELTHTMQQGGTSGTIQRVISPDYSTIKDKLSYGAFDWAITDSEANYVLSKLNSLPSPDLRDTIIKLQADGYLNRLLDNISTSDYAVYSSLIRNIHRIRGRNENLNRIQSLLSYGLFDWAITDSEAQLVLITLQGMTIEQRRVIIYRMSDDVFFDRLLDNISRADKIVYGSLISEIETINREYQNVLVNTSPLNPTQQSNVQGHLTPNIAVDPHTGIRLPFKDIVAGKTYREDIEAKLDIVRRWMYSQSVTALGRTKLPMTRFEGIATEAKKQTDEVFGQYKQGPALSVATGRLIDRSLQPPDAEDLVRYLITNQAEVLPVHTAHNAIPSETSELAIINAIIPSYAAAHKAELDIIDQAWPGIAHLGIVQIQPFAAATPHETRKVFWENFQTLIHEYLHTITHPDYSRKARSLGGFKQSILIEGGTSLFTDEIWRTIFPDEISANVELRKNVEGKIEPFDLSVIPPISHYDQIAQARAIENEVGKPNMKAAYFEGKTDLLGL